MKTNYRRYLIFIGVFLLTFLMFIPSVFAIVDYGNLCSNYNEGIGSAARIIGYIVEVAKWIIPFIIIVLGMIDFGKAALSNDDKSISKAATALIRRLVAGVVVFFIPQLVLVILNLTNISKGIENTTRFEACTKCILNASKYCPLN